MGHERLGTLPKSQRWRDVVQDIAHLPTSDIEVSDIANRTIRNVRSRFRHLSTDDGLLASVRFLLGLAVAFRSEDPQQRFYELNAPVGQNISPLSLAKAAKQFITQREKSPETSQIAVRATIDAIALWYWDNRETQLSLFQQPDDPIQTWRKAATGSGFCELARLFFGKFTERYLKYFLEREASAVLTTVDDRDQFNRQLTDHVERISKHAFETSKITQSFAAGWYNKNALDRMPTDSEIQSFLAYSLGKMREELQTDIEAD